MNDRREILTRITLEKIRAGKRVEGTRVEIMRAIIEATPDEEPPATPETTAPLAQDVEEAMEAIEDEQTFYQDVELATIQQALDAKTSVPDEVLEVVREVANSFYTLENTRSILRNWLDQRGGE